MAMDQNTVERLVEVITREVLLAIEEQDYRKAHPQDGTSCRVECAEGLCVKTCYDSVGHVVSAGAERISSTVGSIPQNLDISRYIDHTLLKPEATAEQIAQLCYEARKYSFASVCINPSYVSLCAELLKGSSVKVCTVVGFPLGATSTDTKVFETKSAIENGATEIDMVINIGALKARDLEYVARDIRSVVEESHSRNALVKVIIETALLTDEEKVLASLLSKEAGADYVKTSTGFSSGGATIDDVALMRRVVGPEIGVKAAGGIRTREDAENMIKAGATRLGASAGVKIVQTAASAPAAKEKEAVPAAVPVKAY